MIETPQPSPDRAQTASTPAPRLARTLVLVGLMGAGKTSVGKRLAALLGVPFIDSDAEIADGRRHVDPGDLRHASASPPSATASGG